MKDKQFLSHAKQWTATIHAISEQMTQITDTHGNELDLSEPLLIDFVQSFNKVLIDIDAQRKKPRILVDGSPLIKLPGGV